MATDANSVLALLSRLAPPDESYNPIDAFRAARARRDIQGQLKNYMSDPEGTIKAVGQIDPVAGNALNTQHQSDIDAQQAEVNKRFTNLGTLLRAVPSDGSTSYSQVIQGLAPMLKQQGYTDDELQRYGATFDAHPQLLKGIDNEGYKASLQQHVLAPGAELAVGADGNVVARNPYGMKALPQGSAQTGFGISTFDPNTGAINGGPTGAAPSPAPAAPPLHPADVYTRMVGAEGGTNPDGSFRTSPKGAVGPAQVMPATGPEAAAAAGLPWDPQRYASDPAYNRQIGEAYYAKQLVRFGGDTAKAAAAYNAGPGRVARLTGNAQNTAFSKLPPETQGYVQKVAPGLFPGAPGAPATAGGATPTIAAAPNAGKPTTRPATAAEIAAVGLPPDTAAQIDSTGKLTVLGPKGGNGGKPKADPLVGYQNAIAALDEIDKNLEDLNNDPHLAAATGLTGHLYRLTPGGSDFTNKIKKIDAQKLVGVAQQLQAGGNPFSRITNMEAQQLPRTLAALDPSQSEEGFRNQIISGRAQIAAAKTRLTQQAQQAGLIDGSGAPVRRTTRGFPGAPPLGAVRKGYTYIGGDPAQPSSWRAN